MQLEKKSGSSAQMLKKWTVQILSVKQRNVICHTKLLFFYYSMLSELVRDHPDTWNVHLPGCVLRLCCTEHPDIGTSPFARMYLREPKAVTSPRNLPVRESSQTKTGINGLARAFISVFEGCLAESCLKSKVCDLGV